MNDLNKKAFRGLLQLLLTMGALLFIPAWTFNYWQAWAFLAVFFASVLAISLFLMKHDPKLLERRIRGGPGAEKERSQQIIQSVAAITFAAVVSLPALDHHFKWSAVPTPIVALGDGLVALGLLVVFFVFKANTYTAATIGVEAGQTVISTGPYALVRHPMYLGALIMLLGVPLALGSWWGLLAVIPIAAVLVWRLLDEEKLLTKDLSGYADYRGKVAHRLIPFIW